MSHHKLISYALELNIKQSLPFIEKLEIDGVSMALQTSKEVIPLLVLYKNHHQDIKYWDNEQTTVTVTGTGEYKLAAVGLDDEELLPDDCELWFRGLPSIESMYTVIIDCQDKDQQEISVEVLSVSFFFETKDGQTCELKANATQIHNVNI